MIYIIYYFIARTLYDGLKRGLRYPLVRGAAAVFLLYIFAPAVATNFGSHIRPVHDPGYDRAAVFWAGAGILFLISVYPPATRFVARSGQLRLLGWFLLTFFWWAVSWNAEKFLESLSPSPTGRDLILLFLLASPVIGTSLVVLPWVVQRFRRRRPAVRRPASREEAPAIRWER